MDNRDNTGETRKGDVKLSLLGGFTLDVGGSQLILPLSAQRILVALGLHLEDQDRMLLGAMLYPDSHMNQVSASLRSALWRANHAVDQALVLTCRGRRLRLADHVDVDLRYWTRRARLLATRSPADLDAAGGELAVKVLSRELLPSWGDDWLLLERQRWDQLRLHALERLVDLFAAAGRYLEALEAGLAAIAIEPYRESAHRALIQAYIAEGNCASALVQYQRYKRLLTRELGVQPTAQLQALVRGLTNAGFDDVF